MLGAFDFCLPTKAITVPTGPDWLHEVKYDGYRLRLERDGDRVRLITRGGHNWTSRYPWIVEAALKNRLKQFVVDGEAVVLGVDGVADFNALHSRKHDHEVQLYAFDIMAMISAPCHCRCARPTLRGCWRDDRTASSSPSSNRARSGPTCFAPPAAWAGGLGIEAAGSAVSVGAVEALGEGEEPHASRDGAGDGLLLIGRPRVDLFLRKVIHPQAHNNYRVLLKHDCEEFEIGSIGSGRPRSGSPCGAAGTR